MYDLSPRAQKAAGAGQARQAGRDLWATTGPRLHEGTVYVPSPYRNDEAKAFWIAQGFTFDPARYGSQHEWKRDSSWPDPDGRRFTPEAWLEATRRRYFEFYPEYREGKRTR